MSENGIPEGDLLRELYTPHEVEMIERARQIAEGISDDAERHKLGREFQAALWPNWIERLQKTSIIIPKDGAPCLLTLRPAQRRFILEVVERCYRERRPVRGIILKARQLGFSTLIQAMHYMFCFENSNRFAMTISYDDESTEELFTKAKFIDDWTWFPRKKKRDRKNTLAFTAPHNSTFYTRTAGNLSAGRGLTIQHLHCSEVPMWSDPDTVMVGLQQAVPTTPISTIFWESTARGALGLFYDVWNASEEGRSDMVPFFAPWFWESEYSLAFESTDHRRKFLRETSISDRKYQSTYALTAEQMKWRRWKIDNDLNGNADAFRQEFPACPQEAFLTTGSPAFDPDKVLALQGGDRPPLWKGNVLLERITN